MFTVCVKQERKKFIDTHICLSVLVYGWRPRKLVTLAASGEGKQVAGDRVGGRILTVFPLCLFNFRTI